MSIPKDNSSADQESTGRYRDEQTDKRIHEHLENKDDEITEQDISNVRTDFFETGNTRVDDPAAPHEPSVKDDEMVKRKKIEDNDNTSIDTSWNILDA